MVKTREVSASVSCHHCQGAPCALVCPVNAIHFDRGQVVVDEKACISCKMCAITCPFGAIEFSGTSIAGVAGIKFETPEFPRGTSNILSWELGVHAAAVKCDLCSFSPDGPSCVNACLTSAIRLVDDAAYRTIRAKKHRYAAAESDVVASSPYVFRSE